MRVGRSEAQNLQVNNVFKCLQRYYDGSAPSTLLERLNMWIESFFSFLNYLKSDYFSYFSWENVFYCHKYNNYSYVSQI